MDEEAGTHDFKEGSDELWKYQKILDFIPKKSEDTVVERIASACPEAAGIFDNHGRLPFHYLAASSKGL
jgi:hypothetical protein